MAIQDVFYEGRNITVWLLPTPGEDNEEDAGEPEQQDGKYIGHDAGGIMIETPEGSFFLYPWHCVDFVSVVR